MECFELHNLDSLSSRLEPSIEAVQLSDDGHRRSAPTGAAALTCTGQTTILHFSETSRCPCTAFESASQASNPE